MKPVTIIAFLALTLPAIAQTPPSYQELYEAHLACDKVSFLGGTGPLSQRKKTWPADHVEKCQVIEDAYQKHLADVNKAADLERAGNLAKRLQANPH